METTAAGTEAVRPWWTSITTQVWALVLMCALLLSGLIVLNTKADVGRERKIVSEELEHQGQAQVGQIASRFLSTDDSWADSVRQITSQPALTSLGPHCDAAVDQ